MTQVRDPYDLVGERRLQEHHAAITAFWEGFVARADDLDRGFSSGGGGALPVEVMAELQAVSPDLMWEFGPSDRGHDLCITAEWRDALRPLARAVLSMAPDLPRWTFSEARTPEAWEAFDGVYETRFNGPRNVSRIDVAPGEENRVALTAHGAAGGEALCSEALALATLALGEAVDRDWIGAVDGVRTGGGLRRLFRKPEDAVFDPAGFAQAFEKAMAKIRSTLPSRPLSASSIMEGEVSLIQPNGVHPDCPRHDLVTFVTPSMAYAMAALKTASFCSANHSRHGEWFFTLEIPRSDAAPFDEVTERGAVEERVFEVLSRDGCGGLAASGHGTDTVYVDCASPRPEEAAQRLANAFRDAPWFGDAGLRFLDAGLSGERFALPGFLGPMH